MEKTLALIKPDAVRNGSAPAIMELVTGAGGFTIVSQDLVLLTQERAQQFYAEHAEREFFGPLCEFMCSGPVVALCLAKPGAIKGWRALMGPTDSEAARAEAPDSVRAKFGTDGRQNAVHGSDSPASATGELKFFFPRLIVGTLPSAEEATRELASDVVPLLTSGLTELCRAKPAEPVAWLAQWLLENNPNKPTRSKASKSTKLIFVLGGPGCGKGTNCSMLKETYKFEHVSSGDLLRAETQNPTSLEAEMIKACQASGSLVPLHVVITLLARAIAAKPGATFLIDGFPRNMEQAQTFERDVGMCESVLFFDAPEAAMKERIMERPKTSGRSNDNLEVLEKRFATFRNESLPVVDYYQAQGKVKAVNSSGSIEEVTSRALALFAP